MNTFSSVEERALCEEFLRVGYVKRPVERLDALDAVLRPLRNQLAELICDPLPHLSTIVIQAEKLNDIRMALIGSLVHLRPLYYFLARQTLSALVGSELAMQRRINLSIQQPGDESSLLGIHKDTDTGDSPFEVVLWVPLTDCSKTASMYFRDHYIDIKYGEMLIFNQAIPHGNVRNDEGYTRWSLNCRFKGLFTPYAGKKLGDFFEPITMKAASMAGLS